MIQDCNHPGPDEAGLRLERALEWRATGRVPRGGLVASTLCHAGLAAVFFALAFTPAGPAGAWPYRDVVPVFTAAPSHAALAAVPLPSFATGREKSPPEPVPGLFPEQAVNLSAIQVSFADDVSGQLPAVLRDQHGMLALLGREDDSTVTQYVFRPPAWEMRGAVVDVSSNLRILMDPPRKWALWREIAARYGIDLERYRAYAVFSIVYRRCLMEAIRDRALARGLRPGGRVSAVRLAFTADRPCGVEVLEVSLANKSVPEPL